MTERTKSQLKQILSALEEASRNPNTKSASLKAIGRHAEAFSMSIDDLLCSAESLIDGRVGAEQFRNGLRGQPSDTATKQETAHHPQGPGAAGTEPSRQP